MIMPPRKLLSVSVALACAAGVLQAGAATLYVSNCNDSGPGSLRDQIAASVSGFTNGDTIDLATQLTGCNLITLGSQISFGKDLTLLGPANATFTIAGSGSSRLLQHTATGTLHIQNLALTSGYAYNKFGDATGGCITSAGTVDIVHSTVSGCSAYSLGGVAAGGGVHATSGISLDHALIANNVAHSVTSQARGGGLSVLLDAVQSTYSTISGNAAIADSADARGGGVYASAVPTNTIPAAGSSLYHTTIEGNSAKVGGGAFAYGTRYDHVLLRNCTVSGNQAANEAGGLSLSVGYILIENSTIAFNVASNAGGIVATGRSLPDAFVVASSIVARNVATGGGFADLVNPSLPTWNAANTLINSYNVAPVTGAATIVHGDPRLAPLALHGGPTRTHALLATSPAIDAGINPDAFTTDQRGAGFARVVGAAPDIGAYERQILDDEIYYGGFE